MRRSTIILLIIFVLLGALVWFMQQPGNLIITALATSTTKPSELAKNLINPGSGPINLIVIQNADGQKITVDKTSGQWIVKTDHDQTADQNLAESAASQALNLRIVKIFDTPPDSLGTGLEKPVYNISLLLSDGNLLNIRIGRSTVTGSGYYVETSDRKVMILSKSEVDSLINIFSKPPLLKTATPEPVFETETPTAGASLENIEGTATGRP